MSGKLGRKFFACPHFCKFFVLNTEVRQVWQHETFLAENINSIQGNALKYLAKTMSSYTDQLSSRTLLDITHTRSVQMHLQAECSLDKSKQQGADSI